MANWCDNCETSQEGEQCSICGADLRPPEREPMGWKWRLFLVATAVYLVWRAYQLISWMSH